MKEVSSNERGDDVDMQIRVLRNSRANYLDVLQGNIQTTNNRGIDIVVD